jgi:molybdate transport system substrate-binding protein
MKGGRILFAAASLGCVLAAGMVRAAEITVLCSNGVSSVINDLGPQFVRNTGHRLVLKCDLAAAVKKQIEAGAGFDVAILTAPITEDLIKQGKIVAGSSTGFVRAGIGVAVRAGAPKPDISTTAAFKSALVAAKSVVYTGQGASGTYFASLLPRLGIAEQMKAIAKPQAGGVGEMVARGEAEMAVQLIPELLAVRGIELVGPFPPELQSFIVFPTALGTGAKEPEAAKALIKFLSAPAAAPVIRSKGMEPG